MGATQCLEGLYMKEGSVLTPVEVCTHCSCYFILRDVPGVLHPSEESGLMEPVFYKSAARFCGNPELAHNGSRHHVMKYGGILIGKAFAACQGRYAMIKKETKL